MEQILHENTNTTVRIQKEIKIVSSRYSFGVTDQVLNTIQGPLETDPIARQYIPDLRELQILPQERLDPIGDEAHSPVKGIIHRYTDRVLLSPVYICAVYCRYCFRREKIGRDADMLSEVELNTALEYIAQNPDIHEVILTGGDPLILSPRRLKKLLSALVAFPHVEIIRIHSRIPVADPQRITPELCSVLDQGKAVYMAIHINHVQEITPEVERSFKNLHKAGCVLLSQSVLLRGVNNNPDTLATLYRALLRLRVKPYYIHHPDLAPGTAHFRLSLKEGTDIVEGLEKFRISGLARPHYMLDIPGGFGKVQILTNSVEELEPGCYRVEDPKGQTHIYKDCL